MSNILVLYYSMYGHVETMAEAVAAGARAVAGTTVAIELDIARFQAEHVAKIAAKLAG